MFTSTTPERIFVAENEEDIWVQKNLEIGLININSLAYETNKFALNSDQMNEENKE